MTIKLRQYQEEAVNKVFDFLRETKSQAPCVVLPTGSGKTLVISALARQVVDWGGRVLIVAHVKELLEQTTETISKLLVPSLIGVYSAGLNKRDTSNKIIVAGIQSVYKNVKEFGKFNLIIVDEAHLIPASGDGMYRTLLNEERLINPEVRLVGLTATPYRLGDGSIIKENERDNKLFDKIVYEANVYDLIKNGTLSDVISQEPNDVPDFSNVRTTRGDFNDDEVDAILNNETLSTICKDIVDKTKQRHKVLIFTNRVGSSEMCARLINELDAEHNAVSVSGDSSDEERANIVRRFKNNEDTLKYVCNVGVFTTGFDAKNVDAIALIRPTQSKALYQQMVGRGLRKNEDKENCLILDYGGNIKRHGPINISIGERAKRCYNCTSIIHANYNSCPVCGFDFRQTRQKEHSKASGETTRREYKTRATVEASTRAILSNGENSQSAQQVEFTDYDIKSVEFSAHSKKNADDDAPKTLQITYQVGMFTTFKEWLTPEHEQKWLRSKFTTFWRQHSNEKPPKTAEECVEITKRGLVETPTKIRVIKKNGSKFPLIVWLDVKKKKENLKKESKQTFQPNSAKTCGTCEDFTLKDDVNGFCNRFKWSCTQEQTSCGFNAEMMELEGIPF